MIPPHNRHLYEPGSNLMNDLEELGKLLENSNEGLINSIEFLHCLGTLSLRSQEKILKTYDIEYFNNVINEIFNANMALKEELDRITNEIITNNKKN